MRRLQVVPGVTQVETFDLVDLDGLPFSGEQLVGATAAFLVRASATGPDVLSPTPVLSLLESTMTVTFDGSATGSIALGPYLYQALLTLADGTVLSVAAWSPLDMVQGGSATPTPPPFDNTVAIDHDYGLSGDLAYRTPGGSPIPSAQIRVYLKSKYDAKQYDDPVGVTSTDADGKWAQPILVVPGYEYVVRFEKPNEFGPDVKTVTVV